MDSIPASQGKRITLKRSRPNPIFEDWLKELYEEAKAKKSKLENKLKDAYESMIKYPLPLETGADCAIINGFDKNLCAFFDKRLEVYNSWRSSASTSQGTTSQTSSKPKKTKIPTKSNGTQPSNESNNSQNGSISSTDSTNAKKKVSKERKPYKPAFRSGGYAILIALLEQLQDNPSNPSLNKDELIAKAQPHSEESFFRPKAESFYTAWSSMSRLVTKGLVQQVRSRRISYSLTDEGVALAIELREDAKTRPTTNDIIFNGESTSSYIRNRSQSVSSENSQSSIITICTSPSTASVKSTSSNIRNGSQSVPTESKKSSAQNSQGSVTSIGVSQRPVSGPSTSSNIRNGSQSVPTESKKSSAQNSQGSITSIDTLQRPVSGPSTSSNIINGAKPSSSKSVPNSQDSVTSISASQRTVSGGTVIELPAGSFDVILLIDKQETSGSTNKKDPTVAQFNKYPDLKHEYRSLKVGDFTWIARSKVNKDQELVLPYVVERKRMDDLGASIKDGRFHEQKFRLRKCGLQNVFYLVEHFGSNKHVGLPLPSLMQALANTRVQDGFKVHMTDSLTNSTRFLAMMTKRLTIEYKDRYLIGSNSEPQGEMLMIFDYFNKSSTKNKPLTVTETFIKLLLQLKGVSVEKALVIAKAYTTPMSLFKRYENCSQKEGEMLLSNLKYGAANRNVGPKVSKAIYKFLMWEMEN